MYTFCFILIGNYGNYDTNQIRDFVSYQNINIIPGKLIKCASFNHFIDQTPTRSEENQSNLKLVTW